MAKKPTSDKRNKSHLATLDMTVSLDGKDYLRKLARVQARLRLIQQAYLKTGNSAAIVFEGWDAAGKGPLHDVGARRPRFQGLAYIGAPPSTISNATI